MVGGSIFSTYTLYIAITTIEPNATLDSFRGDWPQMTKISDKSADNQSEASILVACNKTCHLFCEMPTWSFKKMNSCLERKLLNIFVGAFSSIDDATNAEVSSIVNSPQRNVGEFMSKVIAGLHHHKEGIGDSGHHVMNSTPKYDVEKQSGQVVRGTAEGADDITMSMEGPCAEMMGGEIENDARGAEETGVAGVESASNSGEAGASFHDLNLEEETSPCQKDFQKVSHNLFGEGTTNGIVHREEDIVRREGATEEGMMKENCEVLDKNTDGALPRQHRVNQGFTPIRDYSVDSMESPYPSEMSTASQQAYISIDHMLRQALPYYMYPPNIGTPAPPSQERGDEISLASLDLSRSGPLHAVFSPAEMLDRHISMSDEVHDKELSR